MKTLQLIYVPLPSQAQAKSMAKKLLTKKLIGCANIFPISSFYLWHGKINHSQEYVLLLKTTKKNFLSAKKEVEKLHPYEIPCIMTIPTEVNTAYAAWLQKEMQ